MEPKFVKLPAFSVVGMKLRARAQDNRIPQLWGQFVPRIGEIQRLAGTRASYGVSDNMDESTGEFDYIAACAVDRVDALPEGMVSVDFPEQTYAVFTATLPKIGEAFQEIYQTWLPGSGYQRAPGPEFELYDVKWDSDDPNSEFYLYIPVVKAS
jgi:AraC family transcriptional regulator